MNISLTQNEVRTILRTLLFLAKVDGDISENEFAIIKQLREIHNCPFNSVEELKRLPNDIRLVLSDLERVNAKKYLAKLLIHFCYCDGIYSATERLTLHHIAEGLGTRPDFIFKVEKIYAHEAQQAISNYVRQHPDEIEGNPNNFSWQNIAMTTGLVVGGGAAMAATGGLLAPVIGGIVGFSMFGLSGAAASSAGLAFLGGGSIAAGGGGMAAGATVATSILGLGGAGLGVKTGWNLFGGLEEFDIFSLTSNREACHQLLCIHVFMQQDNVLEETWSAILHFDKYSDIYGLGWESKTLIAWLDALKQIQGNISVGQFVAGLGAKATKAAGGLIALPVAIASAFSLIDNPWHVARNKAELAGKMLAQHIMNLPSPISLVGYSLGARVIGYALEHLAKEGCYGKIYDVYFMGGAIGKDRDIFQSNSLEKLVANNIFNYYSKKDLVLTYLYQTAELGDKPIGLMPIESDHVRNIDVTDIISGHLEYPKQLLALLERCSYEGFKQIVVPSTSSPTEKAIQILQKTPGMTDAAPRDFHKGRYKCHLSDGSIITHWVNNFNVHHVFIASKTGKMIYGGFVGWVHTDGLLESLAEIECL